MFINKHRNSLIIVIVLLTIGAGLWYFLFSDEGGMGITISSDEYQSYDIYGFDYEQSEDEIFPMLEGLLDQEHFDLTVSLEHHDVYVDKDVVDFNSVAKLLKEAQMIREIGYSEVKDEEDQGLNSYWIGYLDKSGNRVSITYYQNGMVNKTVGFIEEGEIVTVSNQLTKDVILMDLKKDNPMFFTDTWRAMVDKEFVSYDEWAGSGLYFRQVGNQGYCTMMIYGSGVRIMAHFTTPVTINEDGTIRMTLPENFSTGYLSEVEGDPEMVEVTLSLTGDTLSFGMLNYTYDAEAHTYDDVLEMTEDSIVLPELRVSYGDEEIFSAIGLNEWDDAKYDRQDTLVVVMETNEVNDLMYIKNDEEVGIEFLGTMPDQMVLQEMIIRDDGRELYTYREVKEVPIHWVNGNLSFTVEDNLASMFSSDSKTYEEGGLLRGYKLTCSFGENEYEYGFVIRSDVSHTFSENHTEKGYNLQAESEMNYYTLTLSSVPGLPIEVSLTTEEGRQLGVKCTVSKGDFITWDGLHTSQVGNEVHLNEENQTIYWTPLNENYDGIDQKTVYATVTMEVIDLDTNESLEVKDYTIYQSYGHFGFDEMPKLPNPDSSS